jgi:hypothetical protein
MKAEDIENLETMRKYMHWDERLSEEENRKNMDKWSTAVDFLCESKEQNIFLQEECANISKPKSVPIFLWTK